MALSFGQHRRLLTTYLAPQRAHVALLAVLLLAGIGLQLLNPQVMRFFIDTAEAGGPMRALLLAALVYLVAGLLGRGLTFATSYVSLNVAWKATNALRSDLTRHCLRLDMPFHKTHTPGEMIERVDGDALALGTFFSQMVVKTAGNVLLVIAILFLLYRENAAAGLILTAYTALIVAVLAGTQNLGAQRWAAARQAWAEQSGFLEEHIAGSEDIRGIGAEQYVLDKLLGIMNSSDGTGARRLDGERAQLQPHQLPLCRRLRARSGDRRLPLHPRQRHHRHGLRDGLLHRHAGRAARRNPRPGEGAPAGHRQR